MIRTRKPLAKVGKRGKELRVIRDLVWPIVRRTAGYKCEGCATPESKAPMQYAHAFGRNGTGAGLGDWAWVPELGFELCATPRDRFGGCHRRYDTFTDAPLRLRLERLALNRLVKKYGGTIREMWSPLENVRTLTRSYQAAGIVPEGGGRLPEPTAK